MTTPKKPTRGRPRRSKTASEARLVARCSEAELAAAEECAKLQGVSLSDFVRVAVAERVHRCPQVIAMCDNCKTRRAVEHVFKVNKSTHFCAECAE